MSCTSTLGGASSWGSKEVEVLIDEHRVEVVEAHMCRFGMTSHVDSREGDHGLVKKPTGFMTRAPCIAMQLERKCDGTRDHVLLMGRRAVAAQAYIDTLWNAIVRAAVQ